MRKITNGVVAAAAVGACAFMAYLTIGADAVTAAYNLGFLAAMAAIIAAAFASGFTKIWEATRAFGRAAARIEEALSGADPEGYLKRIGEPMFGVRYFDDKYEVYLDCRERADGACDVSEFVGEPEANAYVRRKTLETIPDALTSLGVLGTFIGLVWGLRGFDPVSYETMSASISSLVNGIKVAFVTSIFGISLSLAFSYWLKGALEDMGENLNAFIDEHHALAPAADASALGRIVSNQEKQTETIMDVADRMGEVLSKSMERHVDPALDRMGDSVERFVDVATAKHKDALAAVAKTMTGAVSKEFSREFEGLRDALAETNEAQTKYARSLENARADFEADYADSAEKLARAADGAEARNEEYAIALKENRRRDAERDAKTTEAIERVAALVDEATDAMIRNSEANSDELSRRLESTFARLDKRLAAMDAAAEDCAEAAKRSNEAAAAAARAAEEALDAPDRYSAKTLEAIQKELEAIADVLKEAADGKKKKKGLFR